MIIGALTQQGVLSGEIHDSEITGALTAPQTIEAGLSAPQDMSGDLSPAQNMEGELHIAPTPGIEYYEGEYEFTPAETIQTVPIIGKTATRNITVNPIPLNYGRLSWDGGRLTVF